jgi:voltage-gated potassium channel
MEQNKSYKLEDLDVKSLLGNQDVVADIPHDLPFRKWLYSWLLDPNIPGNYQKTVDKWIGLLIVANLFVLVFEHVPALFEPYKAFYHAFDVFSVIVFTIEYAVRFYLAPEDEEFKTKKNAHVSYLFSPFAIIDFLAIAPFYLQLLGIPLDLRILRFLRLLRILKLFRILIPAYADFVKLNQGRTFRQRVHALVFPSAYGGKMQEIFDAFIGVWVLVSVFAVVMESMASVSYVLNLQFVILDSVAVGIFTIEYCMRIYSCVEEPGFKSPIGGRFKQAKTASTLIDFLAILPFFLEVFLHHLIDLRFLRVFRLARLLKLTRYNDATAILIKVVVREWPVMSASAFIMMLLVVLTASLGYLFEHEAQPEKFENIPQSIYWAVITLASVGYGDISPITPMGRAMTIVLALIGIGIFAIPAALLSSAFSDQLVKEREALKANLFEMLKDGHLDEEEANFIRQESKRLHLTTEEVNALIEMVQRENEAAQNTKELPIHVIAERPEIAVEHYKMLVGQIRQLSILTDATKFEQTAKESDSLTATEWSLWQSIKAKQN